MFMLHVHTTCTYYVSIVHIRAACPRCMSPVKVQAACHCCFFMCISLVHVRATYKLVRTCSYPCCMSCLVLAAPSGSPVLAAPSGCPVLTARSWQSFPGSPVLAVLFCQSSPLPVFLCLSCLLYCTAVSCSACPVLPVPFCLSCSSCPVLPVLLCLPCSQRWASALSSRFRAREHEAK
jgi:hypothetical protein